VSDYGWQEGQPRVCAGCGERVTLNAEPLWFRRFPVPETWHFRCARFPQPRERRGVKP
jgi:hypothetical protein